MNTLRNGSNFKPDVHEGVIHAPAHLRLAVQQQCGHFSHDSLFLLHGEVAVPFLQSDLADAAEEQEKLNHRGGAYFGYGPD